MVSICYLGYGGGYGAGYGGVPDPYAQPQPGAYGAGYGMPPPNPGFGGGAGYY